MVQATLQNLACALSLETFVDSLNQLVSTVKFEELAQDTILWIRQIYTRKMSIFAWDYERNRTLWDVIRQLETCLCKDSQVLNQKIQEIWKLQLMYPTEHYDLVLDNICQWESTVELTVFEESSKKRFIKESKYLDKNWRQIHAKSYLEIMQLLEMHLNVRMKDPSWISKGEYLFHALFSINNLMESKKETIMEMYYYFLKKYPQNESKTIIFTALQDMMRSLPEFAFAYLQYLEENFYYGEEDATTEAILVHFLNSLISAPTLQENLILRWLQCHYSTFKAKVTGMDKEKFEGTVLKKAEQFVETYLSESSEYSYFAEIFHASFLARDKKDIKAARAIYENEILNHDPKVASHWISYVELEFYYGNVEKCHSVMKKAYNTFCPPNYLMAFNEEAEELLKLTHFYEKFCRKVGFPLKQGISGNDWNPLLACLKVAMTEKTSGNKEVAPSKPNSHTTLFLSNLDFNTNPEHLKEFLESKLETSILDIRLVYDSKKKFKGFGYLDVPIGEPLKQKCLSLDRVNFLGRPLYISEYKPKSKRAEAEFAEAEEARLKRPTVDEQVHMEMPLFRPSFVRKKPKAKLNLSE